MKKTLVILLAALLLISITACGNGGSDTETDTGEGIVFPEGTGVELVTNEFGEPVTDESGEHVYVPSTEETEAPDVYSEENPTFKDIETNLVVWVGANIRSATVLGDNVIGTVTEGSTLKATGVSEKWYRVDYLGKVGYISKTVAGDSAILATFEDVDPEVVEITDDGVRVRTFPSTDGGQNTVFAKLKKGDKVTRVAIGDGWSRIQYEVISETETGADGQPAKVVKEFYVSNDYIKTEATTGAATEATTEVATEAATEAATVASTEEVKA